MDSLKGAKLLKADGSSVDADTALQGKVSIIHISSLTNLTITKYLMIGSDPVLFLRPLVPPMQRLHSQAEGIL